MGFLLLSYAHNNAVRRKHQIQYDLILYERKASNGQKQLNQISEGITKQVTMLKNNAQVQAANAKSQLYQQLQGQMTDQSDPNTASQFQAQYAQATAQIDAQLAYYTGTVLPQYEETLNAQFLNPAKEEDEHIQLKINQLKQELDLASKEEESIDPKGEIQGIVPKLGGGN